MESRRPGAFTQAQPHIRIVVLTLFEDDDSLFAALRAGARGYILKDANEVEVVRAIRAVSSGEAIFSATMAQRLIDSFAVPRQPRTAFPFPDLTDREREILTLIAQGRTNTEIAQCLVISGKTVRNYISSIFSKLQVADRTHAVIRAREAGLG